METEEEKTNERAERKTKDLQIDMNTLVTNTQVGADAKVVMERQMRAEAQRKREELLENDLISKEKEKCDEEFRGWLDISRKATTEDMQKFLHKQQLQCEALFQSKLKIMQELQQELKCKQRKHMEILKRNEDEINMMTEQMEEQIKLMTREYREELNQKERRHEQETSAILRDDMEEWGQGLKKLWEGKLKTPEENKKKLDEYWQLIHQRALEPSIGFEKKANDLAKKREKQDTYKIFMQQHWSNDTNVEEIEAKIIRMKAEIKQLKKAIAFEETESSKKHNALPVKDIQKCKRIKEQCRHFAVADARCFEKVWQVVEDETKQLAGRALAIDSAISQHLFGLSKKQPDLGLLELTGPMGPWKPVLEVNQQAFLTRKSRQGIREGSSQSGTRCLDVTANNRGGAVCLDSIPDRDKRKRSKSTLKEMSELLCNEADFWMDKKVLKLLAPLVEQGQSGVDLGSLLYTLGLEEEDLPELTDFLLKYQQQQSEQTEDASSSSAASSSLKLIHPDIVRPALKSFLELRQSSSRRISARDLSSVWMAHARDTSRDAAYLESLANIIPEEKMKTWEAAERILRQHVDALKNISGLILEVESLKKQNMELRLQLNSIPASVPHTSPPQVMFAFDHNPKTTRNTSVGQKNVAMEEELKGIRKTSVCINSPAL